MSSLYAELTGKWDKLKTMVSIRGVSRSSVYYRV